MCGKTLSTQCGLGAAALRGWKAADSPYSSGSADSLMLSVRVSGGVVQPLTPAELAGLAITAADFDEAVKKVQPSVRREGFATTPDVTWNDIGALSDVGPSLHITCLPHELLPGVP